jgi:hypothetical protein
MIFFCFVNLKVHKTEISELAEIIEGAVYVYKNGVPDMLQQVMGLLRRRQS